MNVCWLSHNEKRTHPADRRRFAWYLGKQDSINLVEIHDANIVYFTLGSDLPWVLKKINEDRSKGIDRKYIFDFCDSLLERPLLGSVARGILYSFTRYSTFTFSLTTVIEKCLSCCDAVIVSSPEQAKPVRLLNDNVHVIPDCFEFDTGTASDIRADNRFIMLWEGFSSGNQQCMKLVRDLSIKVSKKLKKRVSVLFVTDPILYRWAGRFFEQKTEVFLSKIFQNSGVNFSLLEWSKENLVSASALANVAVIPLPEDPVMKNKPENKLILFLKLGIPCVVSKTEAYSRVAGVLGMDITAETVDELAELVCQLDSADYRNRYLNASNAYIQKYRSDAVILEKWTGLMESF